MIERINRIKGVYANRPDGAFYVFANVADFFGKEVKGSMDFCEKLLDDAYVAAIPGVAFGDDRFIRLTYATGTDHIRRGLERMEKFCDKIRR